MADYEYEETAIARRYFLFLHTFSFGRTTSRMARLLAVTLV
jgi:hypothetical protein